MGDILGALLNIFLMSLTFGLVLGLFVKFFARSLRLTQALLIGWIGGAAGAAVPVIYLLAKPHLQLPETFDGLLGLVMVIVMAVVITRRARAYGIQRTGYLGVGAKSVLVLTVLFSTPVLIMVTTGAFK